MKVYIFRYSSGQSENSMQITIIENDLVSAYKHISRFAYQYRESQEERREFTRNFSFHFDKSANFKFPIHEDEDVEEWLEEHLIDVKIFPVEEFMSISGFHDG